MLNALACIGTAVALFPALRSSNESLGLGFVTSRMLGAAIIVIPAPAGSAGHPRDGTRP